MDIIEVNQGTCNRCGICAACCPGRLIDIKPADYPKPNEMSELACIRCGHCVAVCPLGSLTHREMPVEQCPPVRKSLQITAEQCEHLFRSRRSIRVYENKLVPRDVMVRLIEIARYAPTGHNSQNVEWLVIDSAEKLQRLEEIGLDWVGWMIKNQPKMAALFNMEKMLERGEKQKNIFLRGAPVLVVAHAVKDNSIATVDGTIALTYLELAAKSMGLGGCWAGFVYFMANAFPPMIEALSLPHGHAACGCMMVGYPKYSYYRLPLRKPPHITWH